MYPSGCMTPKSPDLNHPPWNALVLAESLRKYPFITTPPFIITSPMVLPSRGTGCIVSGLKTSRCSREGRRTPCLAFKSACCSMESRSHSSFHSHTVDGPYVSVRPYTAILRTQGEPSWLRLQQAGHWLQS